MTSSLFVARVHSDSARTVRLAAITSVAMGGTTVACTKYCHPDDSAGSGTAFEWSLYDMSVEKHTCHTVARTQDDAA